MYVPSKQVILRVAVAAITVAGLFMPVTAPTQSARAAAPVPLLGVAGPLQPPSAALQASGAPSSGPRETGLLPTIGPVAVLAVSPVGVTSTAPLSVDLSQYNPPVGNQGAVGSCASWATGYYLRGWYATRDGYYPPAGSGRPAGFAPMYLYTQVNGGADNGSTLEGNLDIELQQGIDTRADYTQGDFNWQTQPTSAERAHAASYKIASYSANYDTALSLQQWIENSIAGGNPVVIAIPVYTNFYYATSSSYYIDGAPGTYYGGHAVFASKYDANGLWIENQWGTGWGLNGWAELSWNFVNTYAWEAVNETPLAPPVPATATSVPATATSVPATATATVSPTATITTTATTTPPTTTATAVPTTTATSVPTATATSAPPTASPTWTATNTPAPPTATFTPPPAPPTATTPPPPATNTATPVPPTATRTAVPPPAPTNTVTPIQPTATRTPIVVKPTRTPRPFKPTPTATPRRHLSLPHHVSAQWLPSRPIASRSAARGHGHAARRTRRHTVQPHVHLNGRPLARWPYVRLTRGA